MTIRTWLASAAIAGALAAPGVANATIVDLTISGSLDGHSYTGICLLTLPAARPQVEPEPSASSDTPMRLSC
jgi:hypothetical protein